jgi:hypothetical protein
MFFDWFEDDEPDKPGLSELKLEDFEGIIIHPDGDIALIDPIGYPMSIKADFYSMGSGANVAQGAMAQGATAIEAVRHAIKYVNTCGGKVQSVKL